MSIMWKYLDKRGAAIRVLKDYESMKFIIANTDDEIKGIQIDMITPGSPSLSGMPKAHNPQAGVDKIIRALDEIDVLKERYRQAMEYMDWFKPAWDSLSDDERYILECFYIDDETATGAVYDVCEYFSIERSSAYNRKNRALEKLVVQLYGRG